MQKLIACMLAAAAIVRTDPVLVTRVTDGDAITVASIGRVRLLGIEAVGGQRGRERLESLVLRRWVRLEYEEGASRHQAYVVLETGELVNATLVREGLARVSARGGTARHAELRRAEEEARQFQRGIWARYTRLRP